MTANAKAWLSKQPRWRYKVKLDLIDIGDLLLHYAHSQGYKEGRDDSPRYEPEDVYTRAARHAREDCGR